MLGRYTGSASLAAFMTFGLLFTMQYLVAMKEAVRATGPRVGPPIVFRVREDTKTVTRPPKPEPVDVVEIQPPTEITPTIDDPDPGIRFIVTPPIDPANSEPLQLSIFTDGDAMSLGDVQPVYPERARRLGIEGYVIVSVTVAKNGSVADAAVVESTHRIFERAALEAAMRGRYKPRVVDGEQLAQSGILKKFTFRLD